MLNLPPPAGRFYPGVSAPDAYQTSLPGIAATPDRSRSELAPVPELGQVDERQCILLPGLLNVRTWVRGKRARIAWHDTENRPGLESRLQGIDTHRGRSWTEGDLRTMAQVEVQTWNAADVGNVRIALPQWLRCDGIVSPINGEFIRLPKRAGPRALLAIVWAGAMAGTGGVRMYLPQWQAELGVSRRTVQNWMGALEADGVIRRIQLWRPPAWSHRGARRDALLVRVGPALERLALAEIIQRAGSPHAVDQEQGERLRAELGRRARLRRFDVAGAAYQQTLGWGAIRGVGFEIVRPRSNVQLIPDSPPLGGYASPTPLRGDVEGRQIKGTRGARDSLAVPTSTRTTAASAPPWPPQPIEVRREIRLEGEAPGSGGGFDVAAAARAVAARFRA